MRQQHKNRVAVLIPVYSNQQGLNRSIHSLNACDTPLDVIVVDDGSPSALSIPRPHDNVMLIRRPVNGGISLALNEGLEYIRQKGYPFTARLDAGDVVAPDRFTKQLAYLDAHPECGLVSSFVDFIDSKGNLLFHFRTPTEHEGLIRHMRLNNCLIHPAVMFRSDLMERVGFYSAAKAVSEDYEYFLRIMRDCRVAVLPEVLTFCEYNPRGISVTRRRSQQKERLKLQIRYFDARCACSYLGVFRTLCGLITPHALLLAYKRTTGKSHRVPA